MAIEPRMAAYLAYEHAQASYSAGNLQKQILFENCLRHWPDDSLLRVYIERYATAPGAAIRRSVDRGPWQSTNNNDFEVDTC
jgi:hypothetical protein